MTIKLLLVDDHTVVRRGLQFFLCTQTDFEIVGEAQDGREAIRQVEQLRPDVVLMDLVMPVMNGIEATAYLKEHFPDVKVLVLTSYSEQDYALTALRAGAAGYLLKDMKPDQIVEAIRGAHSGNIQLHPEVTLKLMSSVPPASSHPYAEGKQSFAPSPMGSGTYHGPESITKREREVLALIAQGMNNKEISQVLSIAEKTVKTHVSSILRKLDVADRTQAALYAVKHGLNDS